MGSLSNHLHTSLHTWKSVWHFFWHSAMLPTWNVSQIHWIFFTCPSGMGRVLSKEKNLGNRRLCENETSFCTLHSKSTNEVLLLSVHPRFSVWVKKLRACLLSSCSGLAAVKYSLVKGTKKKKIRIKAKTRRPRGKAFGAVLCENVIRAPIKLPQQPL